MNKKYNEIDLLGNLMIYITKYIMEQLNGTIYLHGFESSSLHFYEINRTCFFCLNYKITIIMQHLLKEVMAKMVSALVSKINNHFF